MGLSAFMGFALCFWSDTFTAAVGTFFGLSADHRVVLRSLPSAFLFRLQRGWREKSQISDQLGSCGSLFAVRATLLASIRFLRKPAEVVEAFFDWHRRRGAGKSQ
jgi:hypothetical protein